MPKLPSKTDNRQFDFSEAEQLTEALIAVHEQLLKSPEVGSKVAAAESLAPMDGTPIDAAEFNDLTFCLEQLERARRLKTGDHSANNRDLMVDLAALVSAASSPDDSCDLANGEERPTRIGRFEIIRELGRGGLGVVLLAYDPVLKRQVALKIPNPEGLISTSLRRRFQREGHATARLLHPHIVPVYEVGEVGPICFIAAAYVDGPNLAQWLAARRAACDPRLAARLIADLAEAMHYAHEQQILHRDLKPSNILLEHPMTASGADNDCSTTGVLVAKITDFGLAKLLDQGDDETRHGTVLGTPAYMAPEQARGDTAAIGRASDIYSLGAILYELLSGQAPYAADSDAGALARLLGPEEPQPLRRSRADVPRDLEAICHLCLEKEPAARYATAGELAADLRRFLAGEPTEARPLSVGPRLTRWSRRKPALAALVAVSLLAIVALAVGGVFYTRDLNRAVVRSVESALVAQLHRAEAVKQELRANDQLYLARMQLADLAIRDGDISIARDHLKVYQPGEPNAQLRGIEWFVLKSQEARMSNQGANSRTVSLPHPCSMFTAQFLPNQRYVATGGEDGRIRIWDLQYRVVITDFAAHPVCANQIRLSADGSRMATASCDRTAKIWQLSGETGMPVHLRTFAHTEPVHRIAWSTDDRKLATLIGQHANDTRGLLSIWDAETGDLLHRQEAGVSGLEWSPDGRFLAVYDGVRILVLRTSDWQSHLEQPAQGVNIAFHPDGRLSYLEHRVGLWLHDLETNTRQLSASVTRSGLIAWAQEPVIVARMAANMVHLIDTLNANQTTTLVLPHDAKMTELTVTRDCRLLMSVALENQVCVTELERRLQTEPSLREPWGASHRFEVVDIDDEGEAVIVRDLASKRLSRLTLNWEESSGHGGMELADEKRRVAETHRRLSPLPGLELTNSADDRRVVKIPKTSHSAAIASETTIHIQETRGGKFVDHFNLGAYARSLAISPDGRTLAAATGHGVELWHAATRRRVASVTIPNGVAVVRFSSDGHTLYCVSGSQDAVEVYRWRDSEVDELSPSGQQASAAN